VSSAGELITGVSPDGEVFNLPNFRAFVRLFNQIALPGLSVELRRMLPQAADLAAGGASGEVRGLFRTTRTGVCRVVNDLGPLRPDSHVAGDFGHKRLVPSVQGIEKLAVSAVQFVTRPVRHTHAIAQGPVDQVDGNLRLRLKRDLVRDGVFLRRSAS
jgi:hypothetical protein